MLTNSEVTGGEEKKKKKMKQARGRPDSVNNIWIKVVVMLTTVKITKVDVGEGGHGCVRACVRAWEYVRTASGCGCA